MARGEKFCTYCKTRNGPRAFACSSCGKGFIVKGVQYPDIVPGEKHEETKDVVKGDVDRLERRRLMGLIQPCQDPHETAVRTKFYGSDSKTFESLDGQFRIRLGKVFLGVDLNLDDGKVYKLFQKRGGAWDLVPGRNRFKRLWVAVKRMEKFQNGEAQAEIKSGNRPEFRSRSVKRRVYTSR